MVYFSICRDGDANDLDFIISLKNYTKLQVFDYAYASTYIIFTCLYIYSLKVDSKMIETLTSQANVSTIWLNYYK